MKAIFTLAVMCLCVVKLSAQTPTPVLPTTPGFMLGPSVKMDTTATLARHKTQDALKQLISAFNASRQTLLAGSMLVYSTMPIKHLKATDKMPVAALSSADNMPIKKVLVINPTKIAPNP